MKRESDRELLIQRDRNNKKSDEKDIKISEL